MLRIQKTGQYRKLKVSERVYDVCKNDHVENGIHFVYNCESYRLLREQCMMKLFINIQVLDNCQILTN